MTTTTNIPTLFRSPRLTYRAIEDTPSDVALFHTIQSDVLSLANSSSDLLRPQTHTASLQHKNFVAHKTLLGVVICLSNPEATPIGSLYLTAPEPGGEQHRNSYVSIDVLEGYRGKGYGSEAIEWVLDWGFRIAGLHRVGIEAYSWNEGARRMYERLGFVYEGCKREVVWFHGGWGDFLSWSMLESEWRERRERREVVVGKEVKKE
ncbi:acyl-CoA N-acyltransferase [Amylocarpus encephaloides]|uniref:Acyl-CoA N-acyltransferase n=1 Tax=Amylocarpus encephaloides TaxID=45428 RepID=A0A9P7YI59_9HELO|nr:acyl-CoA N-acyltransferase [Amylocarpus encephaloides]